MAHAYRRESWNHTATICSVIANTVPGDGPAFTPDNFHPMAAIADEDPTTNAVTGPPGGAVAYLERIGF